MLDPELSRRASGRAGLASPGRLLLTGDLFPDLAQIIYMQYREGLMYAEVWEGMRVSLGEMFSTPGGKALFAGVSPFLSTEFVGEIKAAAASFMRGAAQRSPTS